MNIRLFSPSLRWTLASVALASLAACGGGDSTLSPMGPPSGGSSGGGTSGVYFTGSVATGAAMPGKIDFKCKSGTTSATVDSSGNYKADASTVTAPCLVRATSTDGKTVLHSMTVATGTVNVSTVTELMVANALAGKPSEKYDSFDAAMAANITTDVITKALDKTITYLKDGFGVDASFLKGNDPISKPFVPAAAGVAGDAADKVLDSIFASFKGKTLGDVTSQLLANLAAGPVSGGSGGAASTNAITASGSVTSSDSKYATLAVDADKFQIKVNKADDKEPLTVNWGQKVIIDTATGASTDRSITVQLDKDGKPTSVAYFPAMVDGKFPGMMSAATDYSFLCMVNPPAAAPMLAAFKCNGTVEVTRGASGHPVSVKFTDVEVYSGISSYKVLYSTKLNGTLTGDMTAAAAWQPADLPKQSGTGATKLTSALGDITSTGTGVNSTNDVLTYSAYDFTAFSTPGKPYMLNLSVNSAGGIESIQTVVQGDSKTGDKGDIYMCVRDPNSDSAKYMRVGACGGVTISADKTSITFKDVKLYKMYNPMLAASTRAADVLFNGTMSLN